MAGLRLSLGGILRATRHPYRVERDCEDRHRTANHHCLSTNHASGAHDRDHSLCTSNGTRVLLTTLARLTTGTGVANKQLLKLDDQRHTGNHLECTATSIATGRHTPGSRAIPRQGDAAAECARARACMRWQLRAAPMAMACCRCRAHFTSSCRPPPRPAFSRFSRDFRFAF